MNGDEQPLVPCECCRRPWNRWEGSPFVTCPRCRRPCRKQRSPRQRWPRMRRTRGDTNLTSDQWRQKAIREMEDAA